MSRRVERNKSKRSPAHDCTSTGDHSQVTHTYTHSDVMEKIKTWLHKPKKDAEDEIGPWTSEGGSHQTLTVAKETPQRETAPADPALRRPPTSSPRLPLRALLSAGSDASLPSSPGLGLGLRRVGRSAYSLPASPLLGGGGGRSGGGASRSTATAAAAVSRLWVEAALQRSKKTRGLRPPPALNSQKGGAGEEWSDEEEEEGAELLCADADRWRYCLLTPCVCLRCPSAPPLEDPYVSPESSGSAPSEAWRLYPSLSAWTASADAPCQPSVGHQEDAPHSCLHGDSGEDPCVRAAGRTGSDVALVPQSSESPPPALSTADEPSLFLQGAPDITSCCPRKARPAESCGFCSDDFSVKVSPRQGGSCGSQVLCCHCVSRFVSFLQVQQRSQPAGL